MEKWRDSEDWHPIPLKPRVRRVNGRVAPCRPQNYHIAANVLSSWVPVSVVRLLSYDGCFLVSSRPPTRQQPRSSTRKHTCIRVTCSTSNLSILEVLLNFRRWEISTSGTTILIIPYRWKSSSDKTAEILSWYWKIWPRKFCPIRYSSLCYNRGLFRAWCRKYFFHDRLKPSTEHHENISLQLSFTLLVKKVGWKWQHIFGFWSDFRSIKNKSRLLFRPALYPHLTAIVYPRIDK